jgi:methanogenic corrinoid protein MtbC1
MPEGEHHEIGLLYVHFLLKQRGIYVDYLGANVPTVDLKYLTEVKKVDYLYCHLTSPAKNFKVNKFFEQLGEINNQIPIILSGQLIQMYKGVLAPNIQLKKSLAETLEFLKTL